jgi:hypothetical protein
MPVLAWRTDADGYSFNNNWTFDSTEQTVLAGLAGVAAPLAVAQVVALNPAIGADPALVAFLTSTASFAAAAITASVTLPGFGMCGGMAYSTLDYWLAKAPLPYGGNSTDHPVRTVPTQAPVRSLIWKRLLDSLQGGGALQQTIFWSLVLNQLPPKLGGGATPLLTWTANEWPKIKATIDAGRPCPIGLIYKNVNIWEQHQILVYGYDVFSSGARLYVYDSNAPHNFGETGVVPQKDFLTFDLTGAGGLSATSPTDDSRIGKTLAGFFCTNYSFAAPPGGLDTSFGKFVTWDGILVYMTAYGAVLFVANATELTALGGTLLDPRMAAGTVPAPSLRPRDNALLREHSAAPVFLYQGGAPFWVPDPTQLMNFGGWSAVRVVPDRALVQFMGAPANGTLIREFSDSHVFMCNTGALIPSTMPATSVDVRVVPDRAIQSRLLDKLTLDYSSITSGSSCNGTVSLKTAFPGADVSVALACTQPAVVTVPASVTIPKGTTVSPPFIVASTGVAVPAGKYAVGISATIADATVGATILIEPPGIAQFTISPTDVTAGQSATATIVLKAAYSGPLSINLFTSSSFADVPPTVTINAGVTTVQFQVTTPALNYAFPTQAVQIQASYANITASASLTVEPSVLAGIVQSIMLLPSTVPNGGQTTATVTLVSSLKFPTTVNLLSHAPLSTVFSGPSPLIASMPSTLTIPGGQTSGTFVIHVNFTPSSVTQRTAVIQAIAVKTAQTTLTVAT